MTYIPTTEFVDKLPAICVNLELISVYDVACKSIPELLYLLSQKINSTLVSVEHNDKALEAAIKELQIKLDAYIEAGLTDEVLDILDKLEKDGWFDAMIDERLDEKLGDMSEGNIIAEIVKARDGFTTLGARIDKAGYVFDTIADLQAIVRDTPLTDGTVVEVLGYYEAGDGAGHKRIIASVDDGSGVAVGNKWANLICNEYVYPEHMPTYTLADQTEAIRTAISYAKAKQKVVKLSNRNYKTSETIRLSGGVCLVGELVNDEYHRKARITTTAPNMFDFEDTTESKYEVGIQLYGIEFRGSASSNFLKAVNTATGAIFAWGIVEHCGFDGFAKVFPSARLLGVKMQDIYINNGSGVGLIAGSDNMFTNWFVGAKNDTSFLIQLQSCGLSHFRNLFFTGRLAASPTGAKGIIHLDKSSNNSFVDNWFDYCDISAVYAVNSHNNTFTTNYFRQNLRVPQAQYSGIFTMLGCKNTVISNNRYENQVADVNFYALGKDPTTQQETTSTQISKNAYLNCEFKMYPAPAKELKNIVDEPTQSQYFGKFNNGGNFEQPIYRKNFPGLSLSLTGQPYATIPANSTKSFTVSLPESVPATATMSVRNMSTLESGIVYSFTENGTTLTFQFANITSEPISLTTKTFNVYCVGA